MNRICAESGCKRRVSEGDRHKRCTGCRQPARCPQCSGWMQRDSTLCRKCYDKTDQTGDRNVNWKGGKIYHKAGYIMVSQGGGKYRFEHVLVMEKVLGRALLPGENIHHLNGVRDDNRPENLELWTRPQPSGIRATDAVAWAREILIRYG